MTGQIDESYNIQTQYMIDELKDVGRIDKELMLELVNGIKDCSAFAVRLYLMDIRMF
jgi:hypothetical protein